MKKIYISAIAFASLCGAYGTTANASTIKVINSGDDSIYLYYKGKKDTVYRMQPINPNQVVHYEITRNMINNNAVFDIIASKSNCGNPDLKLLAGSCSNLKIDGNYILNIKQGFKTDCEVLLP